MIVHRKLDRHLLSDSVATEFEVMIANGELRIGEKLPAEETIAKSFGVSRNVLREALKTLRERGLVEIRVGDGAYVVQPGQHHFHTTMTRLIRFSDIDLASIYEVRMFLEVAACAAAALRISDSDIEKLKRVLEQMKQAMQNSTRWVELELEFHMTIVLAVGNPLLTTFMNTITALLVDLFRAGYDMDARSEGLSGHASIIEALGTRDSERAQRAMQLHLERSRSLVLGKEENSA